METQHRPKPGKPVILIIDDDVNNLAMIADFLEGGNFTILVAEDSESGLQRAHNVKPDLILLDIRMPKTDGYEVCRILKSAEDTKDIPVIFMTALAETEHKLKGFQVGAVDYIPKPFQREEVLARVGVHLRNHELTNKLLEEKELLEKRVQERTGDLVRLNEDLRREISERKQTADALRSALAKKEEAEFIINHSYAIA